MNRQPASQHTDRSQVPVPIDGRTDRPPPLHDPPNHKSINQVGRPLTWEESLEHLRYVREHGVLQFLATYDALKDLVKPELKVLKGSIVSVSPSSRSLLDSIRAYPVRTFLVAHTSPIATKTQWGEEMEFGIFKVL